MRGLQGAIWIAISVLWAEAALGYVPDHMPFKQRGGIAYGDFVQVESWYAPADGLEGLSSVCRALPHPIECVS